jgi:hypothetical protein
VAWPTPTHRQPCIDELSNTGQNQQREHGKGVENLACSTTTPDPFSYSLAGDRLPQPASGLAELAEREVVTGALLGYGRKSTTEQLPDRQLRALHA